MRQSARFLVAGLAAVVVSVMPGLKVSAETEAEQAARLKWFTDARFGMFIHFGSYSLAARHEWVKNYENISDAEYAKYAENFAYQPDSREKLLTACKMVHDAGYEYFFIEDKVDW